MAKRKSYNLDFKASVKGNLRSNVNNIISEVKKVLSKSNKQNTNYNIGVNNYKALKSKLLPAVIVDNSKYIEKVKSNIPIQLEENKNITRNISRNKAWIDRLKFNKEIQSKRNENLKDLDKRLYPNMFKREIVEAYNNRSNNPDRYNKLVNQLYKLYSETINDYTYIKDNEKLLKDAFMMVSSKFKKPWETEVYKRLKEYGLDLVVSKELKESDVYRNRPDVFTEETFIKMLAMRTPLSNAELYNLLYAFKAMPTASKQGILDTLGKIQKTNKAIIAGSKYENASVSDQLKYIRAWWEAFREWTSTIDKSLYDSEDALKAFSEVNFYDIESLSIDDKIAGELKERYDKRAEEKINQEIELENMFENTSRFRVHVDQTQRFRKSKNNKSDIDKWNEVIEDLDEDEIKDLMTQLNQKQKEIENERSVNFKL